MSLKGGHAPNPSAAVRILTGTQGGDTIAPGAGAVPPDAAGVAPGVDTPQEVPGVPGAETPGPNTRADALGLQAEPGRRAHPLGGQDGRS